jgi:hypothetical protein
MNFQWHMASQKFAFAVGNRSSCHVEIVAGSAFEAGTDNTAGTILWFLAAMLHYPATLKKAQAELDAVLGPEGYTAPSFQHLEQLTYCVALVKEVFRQVLIPSRMGVLLMNEA